MRCFQLLSVICMLTSCLSGSVDEDAAKEYFDIAGLIETQIAHLATNEATLRKSTKFNGIEDNDAFVPDSVGWRMELQSILEMDINKPVLRGRYAKTDGVSDENSNLTIQELTNVDEEHTGISKVRFYYLDNLSAIRKIIIERREKNPLYHSHVTVSMEFREGQAFPIMSRYNMRGYQKMIFMDSSKYEIDGTIIL